MEKFRLQRLFNSASQRSLIVAIDHALFNNAAFLPGIENMPKIVKKVVDFGAFVTILPGKDGLVHISQISNERVESVNEHLEEGQEVLVKVLDTDARGRIKLSIKEITDEERQDFVAE